MDRPHIVIVDPEAEACPAERCGQLIPLLHEIFPTTALTVQTVTRFTPETLSSPPDLLFLRSSRAQHLTHLVRLLRTGGTVSPLIGLCCASRETPAMVWHSLLNGLDDFLCCPFTEIDLFPRVQRLLQRKERSSLPSRHRNKRTALHDDELVGESPAFLRVVEQIQRIAHTDTTALLSGETGTGKELVARAIHYRSPRHGQPFIPVNCGALPDQLLENELFGHVKGAFTDAASAEHGLLAEAEGGTLFLDEVDALSAAAQVKLLRFLQTREYRPLGSAHSQIANVRIIAATNADLRRQVQAKQFRADLYYRLHILSLRLPPLRERGGDIPLLATHFLVRYGHQHGRGALRFSAAALQKLIAYAWPGNVRELEGVIQRAVVLCAAPMLEPADLDLPAAPEGERAVDDRLRAVKRQVVGQFERTYLIELLTAHGGNVTHAAKQAGTDRRAFQRLLRKHGVDRREYQV